MAKLIDEGRSELTPAIQNHWDQCLQCRACEAVCPSGVPYGRIQEHARAQIAAAPASGGFARKLRRFALRNVVARPKVLALAVAPARWYGNSLLRPVLRKLRLTRALGPLRTAERQLPRGQGRPSHPAAAADDAAGGVLFTGCIMGELFGNVHRATLRVYERAGIALQAAPGQGCCGALHAHDGDLKFARKLARENIDGLQDTSGPIIVNSAGCGAAMKEYGDLLSGDSKYAERAAAFSARVKDASEHLAGLGRPVTGTFQERVTYQDACHLVHAQRIREQPRALLGGLSGCELVETPGADVCCGAAGIYSLVQPKMSGELRKRKAEQFAAAQPDVIVTANPGCHMQYLAAVEEAGIKARVLHVMEALDEASR